MTFQDGCSPRLLSCSQVIWALWSDSTAYYSMKSMYEKVTLSRPDRLFKTVPMCSFHVQICQCYVVAFTVSLLFIYLFLSTIREFDSLIFCAIFSSLFTDLIVCIYVLHSISLLFRKVTKPFSDFKCFLPCPTLWKTLFLFIPCMACRESSKHICTFLKSQKFVTWSLLLTSVSLNPLQFY